MAFSRRQGVMISGGFRALCVLIVMGIPSGLGIAAPAGEAAGRPVSPANPDTAMLIDEMRLIRGSLERLTRAMEASIRLDEANLVLRRIEKEERRVADIEAQQREVDTITAALRAQAEGLAAEERAAGSAGDDVSQPMDPEDRRAAARAAAQEREAIQEQLDEATRRAVDLDSRLVTGRADLRDLEKRLEALLTPAK